MFTSIGKPKQRIEKKSADSEIPLCPYCHTSLDQEWEDEVDELGDKTGYTFEIYQCYICNYKEAL